MATHSIIGPQRRSSYAEFGKLAKTGNTMILPADAANVASRVKIATEAIQSGKNEA